MGHRPQPDPAQQQEEQEQEQELRQQQAARRAGNQKIMKQRINILKRTLGGSSVDNSNNSLLG